MKKNCKRLLLACPIPIVLRFLPYADHYTFPNVETYSMATNIDLAQNRHYQLPQLARIVPVMFRLREKKVPVTFLGDF